MQVTTSFMTPKGRSSADKARLAEWVETYMVTAKAEPSFTGYNELVSTCVEALEPKLDILFGDGYQPWMLLAGTEMTPEKRVTFPGYSLFNPIAKLGITSTDFVEKTYEASGKLRNAGLYQCRREDFYKLCVFMTENSWSLLLLSKRAPADVRLQLDEIYDAADLLKWRPSDTSLNWQLVSLLLCDLDDVVVRTFGSADDKYRTILSAYGRSSEVSAKVFRNEEHA